jgi:hypothetical protein
MLKPGRPGPRKQLLAIGKVVLAFYVTVGGDTRTSTPVALEHHFNPHTHEIVTYNIYRQYVPRGARLL